MSCPFGRSSNIKGDTAVLLRFFLIRRRNVSKLEEKFNVTFHGRKSIFDKSIHQSVDRETIEFLDTFYVSCPHNMRLEKREEFECEENMKNTLNRYRIRWNWNCVDFECLSLLVSFELIELWETPHAAHVKGVDCTVYRIVSHLECFMCKKNGEIIFNLIFNKLSFLM